MLSNNYNNTVKHIPLEVKKCPKHVSYTYLTTLMFSPSKNVPKKLFLVHKTFTLNLCSKISKNFISKSITLTLYNSEKNFFYNYFWDCFRFMNFF